MAVLAVDHVTKRFGDFVAVDDLSFSVPEGCVFGFLGGNGAGKTTTLRMALDILRPTSGHIEVLGGPPDRSNARKLGFLPEERGLYRRMTVLETIIYFGQLKGMTRAEARSAGTALAERFDLGAWITQPVEKLSKGMSQKVQLATALVNQPKFLILDEPFAGLDPVNQSLLEAQILDTVKAGATVVFSTHVMQHAERLSDRILLLSRGRKAFEGTLDQARKTLPAKLRLICRTSPAGLPGVKSVRQSGVDEGGGWSSWDVELTTGVVPGDLLEACTSSGFALRDFDVHKPSLHEAFLHIVGEESR